MTSTISPNAYCCMQLAESLGKIVSMSGNSSYTTFQASYWSLQEANLIPQCVVTPTTPEDVAKAVSIMTDIDGCQFAVKGQTHAPAAGFANIDGGVTMDMTGLNSVTVAENLTVAHVGAGASWLDVYEHLDPLGVEVAGGRNGAVGVGGLLLGGGISHFTARVGWACDNVINFQIVLASGEIVNANATSNQDLFRSLKGGGNNFGVITRFDLVTFPQGQISVTSIVNSISDRGAVFQAFTDIADAPNFDPSVSLVTGLLYNSTSRQWLLTNSAVYTQPDLNPPVFQNLKSIPSISISTSLTNLSAFANESATPPLNWLFWTGTYGVSSSLMSQTFDLLNETLSKFDGSDGIVWSIAFEPLPTLITSYGLQKGGNSLGTSPSNGNAYIMLLSALWPDSSTDAIVQDTARQLGTRINHVADAQHLLHAFQYLNYADPSQNPLQSYGAENFARLVATSRTYDPAAVFQRRVPGGFKLM